MANPSHLARFQLYNLNSPPSSALLAQALQVTPSLGYISCLRGRQPNIGLHIYSQYWALASQNACARQPIQSVENPLVQ
jgi:hypothetical protein